MSFTSTPSDGKLAPPPTGPPAPGASGRKRQHDVYTATEDLLKHPVVVKPYPPKLSVKPRSLQPLMVLPREWLPLSCLDLALPHGMFGHARFFESAIRVLELEGRMGTRPVLLIARLEADQTVYALERQDSQLYSLCKLGSWVNLEDLSRHATVAYTRLIKPRVNSPAPANGPLPLITPQLHRETKSRRLAIEAIQSLVKRPARSPVGALGSQVHDPLVPHGESASAQPTSSAAEQMSSQQDAPSALDPRPGPPPADSVLDSIRNQYREALYHSKGSLAYFAKGPLSRARAACPMDHDANPNMDNLVEFLKGLILTTVQIDKKYREAVPLIIAKAKAHVADLGDEPASRTKQKKAKKIRLGKDGLYPREDGDVQKWWAVHKPQFKDEDHVTTAGLPQESRLQISCLRTRETQLQMILVLEILALESLRTHGNLDDTQLPDVPDRGPSPEGSKQPPAKKRNKHNLPMLLDVHADRLSIWQTTALDEIKVLDDAQAGQPREAKQSERPGSDPLRDFCIDIIVPFFSARLPGQCSSLNRKLGGPIMPSPSRTKSKKPEPAAKSRQKSGVVVKRPGAPKQTRTLERVLSKETERHRRSISRGPSGVIALMRSASTPTLPVMKRETSEPAPLANAAHPGSKDSYHVPSTSARRVVSGDKAKKEAQVQAELHDAIFGLRKPNREVVGKAMAEADERRATTSLSQLRKSRKPTQHTGSQNVIKATPAGPRFRDALAREVYSQPATNSIAPTGSVEADRVPASWSLMPSSTPKKRDRAMAFSIDESPALPRSLNLPPEQVAATPVRPSDLQQPALPIPKAEHTVVLASSPVPPKRSQLFGVPSGSSRIRDSGIAIPSSPSDGQSAASTSKRPCVSRVGSLEGFVTVTPVKKRAVDFTAITPIQHDAEKTSASKQASIYNQLGWDEYDDLL